MANVEKSDGAFRTIREVADWLAVPTHVLRFWESKFAQIAPVKGAGGRRYYRPEDMRLLGGIKVMLHDQGLTVRGVGQRIDDDGVEAVMELSPDLDTGGKAPPAARRVIRPGDDLALRRPPSPAPRPAPPSDGILPDLGFGPDDPTPQPGAPDPDEIPGQPKDVDTPPQPIEDAPVPEEEDPQPEPEEETERAPGSDPEPIPTDERGIDPERQGAAPAAYPLEDLAPAAPLVEDAEPDAPATAGDRPAPALDAIRMRGLRRVVRRLRALIEDVEEELGDAGPRR